MEEPSYLVVGRFRKPHGLNGDAIVFPMTDDPDEVFVPGRVLVPVDQDAVPIGEPLTIQSARSYQRNWLIHFDGMTRVKLEQQSGFYVGTRQEDLRAPSNDELWVHEIPGVEVFEDGVLVGVAKELIGAPGQEVLVVTVGQRELLIPFREPILQRIDRAARRITVILPEGLADV